MAGALSEARTLELALEDSDGRAYFGRIEASKIAFDDHAEITVYLTVDERMIVYDPGKLAYRESDNPESDLDFLSQDAYVDAMNALGLKPVIDL